MIRLVRCAEWLLSEEAKPLIADYAKECSIPAVGPINPQPETYAAMEDAGLMQSFAAYEGARLAGFANLLTPIMPHYGVQVATVETLYIAEWSSLGGDLMRALVDYGKQSGCVGLLATARTGGRFERYLEASKSYERTNAVFFRRFI